MSQDQFFDKEKVYDEKIFPLMSEIIKICKEENIPIVASFYLKDETEEEGPMLCTTYIPFDREPDKFKECYHVLYKKPSFAAFTVTVTKDPEAY